MAHFVQAISLYGPRLVATQPAYLDAVARRIGRQNVVEESVAAAVLSQLDAALLHFALAGTPVKLPGVGRFAPSIKGDGRIRIAFRQNRDMRDALNLVGAYHGAIRHRENIGLTPEEYKALWDAEHPDDPLELSPC